MADLVICYSRDGEAVASRLAGALKAEGFSLWSEGEASAPITDRIEEVKAAIVIWSDAARSSDWTRAEANYARGQKKLVQISADDQPPPMPFDPNKALSLAGWSGEQDHPGWQKVKSQVEALVSPFRPAMVAPAVPAPRRREPPPPQRRGGLRVALVLIAVAAAIGAFLWMRSGPPFGRTPAPIALPKTPEQPRLPEAPPLLPPPTLVQTENEVGPAPEEAPAPATPVTPAAGLSLKPEPVEARPSPPPPVARPAPRPSGPRINRRNSENMRLFCQRAGRGTPQCRTFQRQLRNQQR